VEMIRRETENKKNGKDAGIVIKANSLTDDDVISELYEASAAGVPIDLVIRGICSLRPGLTGLSENIRVRSIVGRFLEHSRIYWFANAGSAELYVGSADLMHRSYDRRVEIIFPILAPQIAAYLKETVLDAYLRDELNARVLQPDGSYKRVARRTKKGFDSQIFFAVGQRRI